jgi:hypothetical protein
MNIKANISEIVDAMDMQSDDSSTFYNKKSGKFLYVNDDLRYEADQDKPIEEVTEWMQEDVKEYRKIQAGDDEYYVSIPDKFEIHEYRIMEKFCYTIETEQIVDQLTQSIKGRGAFRRFRDTLFRLGLEQRWYKFKDDAFRRKAKDWCEINEIKFIDE